MEVNYTPAAFIVTNFGKGWRGWGRLKWDAWNDLYTFSTEDTEGHGKGVTMRNCVLSAEDAEGRGELLYWGAPTELAYWVGWAA